LIAALSSVEVETRSQSTDSTATDLFPVVRIGPPGSTFLSRQRPARQDRHDLCYPWRDEWEFAYLALRTAAAR